MLQAVFIKIERLLPLQVKEWIAKSLVYFFTIKEINEYRQQRYQGHAHVFDASPRPLNIAHRGFSGIFPENTLPAFEQALAAGADVIELDVQLSCDGEIVVCHDADLKRFSGKREFIRDLSRAQLRDYDVGAWKGPEYAGCQIPTLAEVFACVGKQALINIEIKHEASSFVNWKTEKAVLELILAHQMEDQVVISAFNPMIVNRIRKLAPQISTAYLLTQSLNPLLIFLLARIRARYLHVDLKYLNPRTVKALNKRGLQVLGYTLNHPEDYAYAQTLGLQGVFTDYPDRLAQHLQRA